MTAPEMAWREGVLALADGSVFEGEVLGFDAPDSQSVTESSTPAAAGEVVFNTVMTGYQEVLTDPSYAGQMISFTYPHIGNYGVAPDDDESRRPFCRGVIVRELTGRPSNWRAVEPLAGFLRRHGLQVISGVDTRRLTRQLRDGGSVAAQEGIALGPALMTRRACSLSPGPNRRRTGGTSWRRSPVRALTATAMARSRWSPTTSA